MLRFVNICLVLGLVVLAYVIYEVKYEARGLDDEIAVLKKDIDAERDSVSVLRAEWSVLNRPERIERLAQKYLKLQPARPDQLVALDTFSDADFARTRLAAAAPPEPSAARGAKPERVKPEPAKTETAKTETVKPAEAAAAVALSWTASVIPATVQAAPVKPRTPITASAAGD